jgi:hypothetical protein
MGFFDGFSSRRKADSGAWQKRDSVGLLAALKIRIGGRRGDPGTAEQRPPVPEWMRAPAALSVNTPAAA